MLGELGHLDGRPRRMRFALGCTGAELILPPWGRTAGALWATIGITAASFTIHADLIVHYRLGAGDWIALAVVPIICVGYLLGASALLRRSGIALPSLLGGVFATAVGLGLSGSTAVDLATFDLVVSMLALTALAASLQLGGR